MSTADKPKVGQRFQTKYDPFTVTRYDAANDWSVKWDDGIVIEAHGRVYDESFTNYCAEFEARPLP